MSLKVLLEIEMKTLLIATLIFFLQSAHAEDPLKNSKQLITKGHKSLYNNGAIKIPYTTMTFIPAGPSALEFAEELVGIRAHQSLLLSIQRAQESTKIISKGSMESARLGKIISDFGVEKAKLINEKLTEGSVYIVTEAKDWSKYYLLNSFKFSKKTSDELSRFSKSFKTDSFELANKIDKDLTLYSTSHFTQMQKKASKISNSSGKKSSKLLKKGFNQFIIGHATLGDEISKHYLAVTNSKTLDQFSDDHHEINKYRKEKSDKMLYFISDTIDEYDEGIKRSFKKAGKEFNKSDEYGHTFATIKALRWVLQGIFWDGIIAPFGKVGAGALGYTLVNGVMYPVMLGAKEGVNTIEIASEVLFHTGAATFDVFAPTAAAALSTIFSGINYIGGKGHSAAISSGAYLGSAAINSANVIATNSIKGAAVTGDIAIRYVGVPLAVTGITIGSSALGVAVGTTGIATGASIKVGAEVATGTTAIFGNLLGASTAATGVAISTVGGLSVGLYELSKAIVVPPGYALGSGIVLSYGTLSQLGAQSILAVSDAAYLVLSLEGPRWVIYAISGKLDKGDDLIPGTVLDLKKMHSSGEEIKYLPVSNEEMEKVIQSLDNKRSP